MSSYLEIKKQLEKYWFSYLDENSKRFSRSTILGASPPSVFVGQYGYPKVNIGPMVPPDIHGNTSSILDSPERWLGKTLQEILNYRLSLVRGLNSIKINDLENKFILSLQELTMSSKPAESEVNFHKIPAFHQPLVSNATTENSNDLNKEFTPFGPQAEIKSFKLSFNTSTNKKIDNMYSDNTIKATDAVIDLYNNGIEISQINKVLSLGMLGRKNKRHLVPTRWSISATDDIISSYLVKKIELYQSIDKFEVIKYNHFSNYYSIIFIPSDVWSFEMVEAWYDQNNVNKFFLESDYEDATGLDHYPRIAGAYFAAKLGVLEYLTSSKKRKCSVLVLREIRPEYLVPLGVWQIREGIRDALRSKQVAHTLTTPPTFSDFRKALLYASKGMTVPILNWLKHSIIYKNYGKKTLISDFF